MFGTGSLAAATLFGLGVVLVAVGAGARLAARARVHPFPVPLVVGLVVAAVGPLHPLRPDPAVTRAGTEIAVVVLLFCVGLDHGAADRRAAAATLPVRHLLAADAVLNFGPGALFGLVAGVGFTGAVLLGGVTASSSWAVATGLLDRERRFGNRETPAVLAALVTEHTATAAYLPLAAALLAPGGGVARATALLGSAAAVLATAWLVLGPAPLGPSLFAAAAARLGSGSPIGLPLVLAGIALALAGLAAALGVATAGVAYLAGVVLASAEPAAARTGRAATAVEALAGPAAGVLRDLSAAGAGLGLGLLIPAAKLPGAVAGGLLLAALSGATKVLTGWWAAGRLRPSAGAAPVGRAGRLRAGLTLLPRGELAVAIGALVALSAPDHGPGTGLAALVAVEVVLTTTAPAVVRGPLRPGWYRWAVPTPAAVRPEPPGAG
ncbi:MAG TPA: cation:proton antiporter [Acidimicrobiia bacterium]|nr:cation:proton antiporter [Acidimicrobiia bacterium]